jgi:hypothetical protein
VSESETPKERATRILSESLEDASIDEGHNSFTWSQYFQGRVEIYWEKDADQSVILVVDAAEDIGQVRSVVALEPLSESIAEMFSNDDDAAMAWENVFHYFLFTLDPLPQLYISLERRRIGLHAKGKEMQEAKTFYEQNLQPIEAELEARRLRLFKYLQGESRRGGSEARVPVSDQQCALLATEFEPLLKHWRRCKKWQREGGEKWREHCRIDFQDTPDDLLDRLDDKLPTQSNEEYPGIPAVLALEHAARRCGLPANIYSYSTLKTLRRRGQATIGQMDQSD